MIYRFIKIRGQKAKTVGYYAPRLYKLGWSWNIVRCLGINYVLDRLAGWTVCWVTNEYDCKTAINILNDLQKTYSFEYKVM